MWYPNPRTTEIAQRCLAFRALLAMLVVSSAACATGSASPPFAALGQPSERSQDVTVEVLNTSYYDMVIRLDLSGVGHKLGTVRSGERRALSVPRALARASNFVLVAEQVNGPDELWTVPLAPQQGQQITWELGNTRFSHRLSIR